MKPVDFRYVRPRTLDDALGELARANGEAKVIAGGQSLGPLLNMRLARPALLVDVNALPGLDALDERTEDVRFGATVRQRDAERSATVARRLPLMRDALPFVGHVHTRNRGTVVGSIVHADPTAELPLVARCLDAVVEIVGPRGRREVPVADFYLGYLTTDLAPEELVVAVRFPAPTPAAGAVRATAFTEMARREGDFALVAAAAQLDVARDGRIVDARLGLAGIGGVPVRLCAGEELLRAAADPPRAFGAVVAAADAAIDPDGDLHATAAYRRSVAATLLGRVLETAWRRARAVPGRG
ncbi:MAG: FAD binding domain-containing protein [Vulcanimicrobiaceae bacterium]